MIKLIQLLRLALMMILHCTSLWQSWWFCNNQEIMRECYECCCETFEEGACQNSVWRRILNHSECRRGLVYINSRPTCRLNRLKWSLTLIKRNICPFHRITIINSSSIFISYPLQFWQLYVCFAFRWIWGTWPKRLLRWEPHISVEA